MEAVIIIIILLIISGIGSLFRSKPTPNTENEQERKIREAKELYLITLEQHNKSIKHYLDENRNYYQKFNGKKITESDWITWKHNLGRLCDHEIRKEAFLGGPIYSSLGISRQIRIWEQLDLIPGVNFDKVYTIADLNELNQKMYKLVKELCIDMQIPGHYGKYTGKAPRKYYYDDYK